MIFMEVSGMNMEQRREATEKAVQSAAQAWAKAPPHIKVMAGTYVAPLLEALQEHEKRIANVEAGFYMLQQSQKHLILAMECIEK